MIRLSLLLLAGCASPDDLRIVQPVTWTELDAQELHDVCRDWSDRLKGCLVSGVEGDHIYLLKHDGR